MNEKPVFQVRDFGVSFSQYENGDAGWKGTKAKGL